MRSLMDRLRDPMAPPTGGDGASYACRFPRGHTTKGRAPRIAHNRHLDRRKQDISANMPLYGKRASLVRLGGKFYDGKGPSPGGIAGARGRADAPRPTANVGATAYARAVT